MSIAAKLSWYYNRLKSMSAEEVVWRIKAQLHELVSLIAVYSGWQPKTNPLVKTRATLNLLEPSDQLLNEARESSPNWVQSLVLQADQIINHKLSYFNLQNVDLGRPINWQLDRNINVQAPMKPVMFVDYRQATKFGDCKLVWEPNRHHQLLVLARAFKITNDEKYAKAVFEQIFSWIEQNPFGYGMNWRSPLELGVRLVNWVWAIDLVSDSNAYKNANLEAIRNSAYQHCYDIQGKYSQGTSANNHLIGEATGVFVASIYFNFQDEWVQESKNILEHEIQAQSYPDGGSRELAQGYQYFVLQFYMAAGITGMKSDQAFTLKFQQTYKRMTHFLLAIAEGGDIPQFCDGDDGYVLNLGGPKLNRKAELIAMSQIFEDKKGEKPGQEEITEVEFWLNQFCNHSLKSSMLESAAFPDSGYYLLQNTNSYNVSLMFDCGPLGYTNIAAHGHADALSFVLRIEGENILIDPGTYDYFTYPEWRSYFKSTQAHNTVEIDELDQSVMKGLFLWDQHAESSCDSWEVDSNGGKITAHHDGYLRLSDPVLHTRTVELDGANSTISVIDNIDCKKEHRVKMHYHYDHQCQVNLVDSHTLEIRSKRNAITMILPDEAKLTLTEGSDKTFLGHQSIGYHHKVATTSLVCELVINQPASFTTKIQWR